MECSLFGLCLFLYIGYIFIKNKNINKIFKEMIILTAVCSLNIRMGYMLKSGNNTFSFSSILVYLTGLLSLHLILNKRKVQKKLTLSVMGMFAVISFGAFRNIMVPYEQRVITGNWTDYVLGKNVESYISGQSLQVGYYLTLFFIGLILIASNVAFSKDDFGEIFTSIIKFSKLSIIVGYIEYFTKNIFHSQIVTDLFIAFLGSQGAQQNELVDRGGHFAVQGATKESSMFTTVLFYIAVMLIIDYANNKLQAKKKWILGCLCLLVLNPAVSSIVYLCIICLICISYNDIIGVKKFSGINIGRIILIVLVMGGVIYSAILNIDVMLNSNNYLLRRIGLSLQQLQVIVSGVGTLMYSSEAIRLSGIIYDLKLFIQRPFLGFGLGAVSCNSGIVTMLVNVGILGFLAWYFVLNKYMSIKNSFSETIFSMYIVILPSIVLNDYETIFCIVIPIVLRCFSYLTESNVLDEKTIDMSF